MNSHLDPDLLSAYLDDEVTPDERALITKHLPGCEACQRELESLRWTVALLHRLPEVAPPRTFYVTEAMVAAPAPRQPWWKQWRNPFLGSLGAVAALLLCVLLVRMPQIGDSSVSSSTGAAAPEIALEAAPAPGMPADEAARQGDAAENAGDAEPMMDEVPAEEPPEEAVTEAAVGESATEAITTSQATALPEEQVVEELEQDAPAEDMGDAPPAAESAPEATLAGAPEADVPEIAESAPVQETEQIPFVGAVPEQPAQQAPNRAPLLVVSSLLVLLALGWVVWRGRQR